MDIDTVNSLHSADSKPHTDSKIDMISSCVDKLKMKSPELFSADCFDSSLNAYARGIKKMGTMPLHGARWLYNKVSGTKNVTLSPPPQFAVKISLQLMFHIFKKLQGKGSFDAKIPQSVTENLQTGLNAQSETVSTSSASLNLKQAALGFAGTNKTPQDKFSFLRQDSTTRGNASNFRSSHMNQESLDQVTHFDSVFSENMDTLADKQ
eukprot:3941863-Rhodomonas_salina.1